VLTGGVVDGGGGVAAVLDEVVAGELRAGGADGVDEVRGGLCGGELEREVEAGRLRHQERGARHERQAALVRRAPARARAAQPELLGHPDAAGAGRPPRHRAAPHHGAVRREPHRHVRAVVRRRQHEAPRALRAVPVLLTREAAITTFAEHSY
jgi:hypothetical protein